MRRPCIFKPLQGKLKIDQYKKTIHKGADLPQVAFKADPTETENVNQTKDKHKIPFQLRQQRKLGLSFATSISIKNQNSAKIQVKKNSSLNKKSYNLGRSKKSFSTSKVLDCSNNKPTKHQDSNTQFMTTLRPLELRYLKKQREIASFFSQTAILVKYNPWSYSISKQNLNKLLNSLIHYQYGQGIIQEEVQQFLRQNTFLREIERFFQSERDQIMRQKLLKGIQRQSRVQVEQLKHSQKIESLLQVVYELQDHERTIRNNIEKLEERLAQLNGQFERVTSYTSNSSNMVIQVFGSSYKELERQIQDFAISLQAERFTKEVKQEMKPFRDLQFSVIERLRRMNKMITFDLTSTPTEKCQQLSNYITNSIQVIRNRDEQIRQKLSLRTDCIQKFIALMKQWSLSWSFKTDYLTQLKKEFIFISQEVTSKFDQIASLDVKTQADVEKHKRMEQILSEMNNMNVRLYKTFQMSNIFY